MGKVVAFFISPHGFGHAARVCSVIQALSAMEHSHRYLIFTTVPQWFFSASLDVPYKYYPIKTDIGLIQFDPIKVDLVRSLEALDSYFPLSPNIISEVTRILDIEQCDLIISDISPLGIKVAHQNGIPSVLIENFTWDWIYRGYEKQAEAFGRHADYLEEIFGLVTWHVLAEPYCEIGKTDLVSKPISRKPKTARREIKKQLGLETESQIVIVSMGGIESKLPNSSQLQDQEGVVFLVPGSGDVLQREGNIIHFPHKTQFCHPDLIQASDVVISKIGYSTLAEVYQTGKPFGYIPRAGFRESEKLENYVKSNMAGVEIQESEYRSGEWVLKLEKLLNLPSIERAEKSGAEQVAQFLMDKLNGF